MKLTYIILGGIATAYCEGRNLREPTPLTFPLDTGSATIKKRPHKSGHNVRYCRCGKILCDCSQPKTMTEQQERAVRGPSDFTWRNMAMNDSVNTEDYIVFFSPTHHEKLVDYCLEFNPKGCGQKAADLYCFEKNFGPAVDYAKRRVYDQVTLTMDEHSTCTPEDNVCIAFEFIACSVLEQVYYHPVMHEYALDGCYNFEEGCGDDAADEFCRQQGYVEAKAYAMTEADELTMTIGNHAVCNPEWHECTKFRYITCVTPMGYRRSRNRTQAQDFADEFGDPHSDHREIENVKNHGGTGNHHQHKHANRFKDREEGI